MVLLVTGGMGGYALTEPLVPTEPDISDPGPQTPPPSTPKETKPQKKSAQKAKQTNPQKQKKETGPKVDTPQDPQVKEPTISEPKVDSPVVESAATNPSPTLLSNQYLLTLTLQGGTNVTLKWTAPLPVLTITNTINKEVRIETVELDKISQIRIQEWRPRQLTAASYVFEPGLIEIELLNGVKKTGHSLSLLQEISGVWLDKEVKAYAIFYDQWIPGEKNIYRWKNTRAGSFSYNFTHPLKGVVTAINFVPPAIRAQDKP